MPKNVVVVGQRGAAIIDAETSKSIKGFCTYDLEDCIGFYLVGNNATKHGLMHIDRQTSAESIADFVRENFENIGDYRIILNPAIEENREWMEIAGVTLKKLDTIDGFQYNPRKSIKATKGTVLVELDQIDRGVSFNCDYTMAQLQDRHTYDRDFEKFRKNIHYINGIFGNSVIDDNEFPIDLQFDGMRYTKLPQLMENGLSEDLEGLKEKSKEEITAWLLSEETIDKYPHLTPLRTTHTFAAPLFANEIKHYFVLSDKCALTEYKIPLPTTDLERERRITSLASSIGEVAEFAKHRSTDWSDVYCSVKLKSESLKKDVRESIGLDRVKIIRPDEQQEADLLEQLPKIIIEEDRLDRSKVLVTFPLSEENRKIIKDIIEPTNIPSVRENRASQLTSQALSHEK